MILSSLTNEKRSSEVRAWLGRQSDELCTSDWVATEVASAFAIKVRTRQMTEERQKVLWMSFGSLRRDSLRQLIFRTEFFDIAAEASFRPRPALRAGGALHLAMCMHYQIDLCTLDAEQAKAGAELGIGTKLL